MGFEWARRGFGFVDSLLHFKGLRGKESPFAPHVELALPIQTPPIRMV